MSEFSSKSKADRKFEKKLEFYAKIRNNVTSLKAQKTISKLTHYYRVNCLLLPCELPPPTQPLFGLFLVIDLQKRKLGSRQRKLKVYDLSSLTEFLPELKAPQRPTPSANIKLNSKSRQKLTLKEGKQLKTVLNHPAFQMDPLDAIRQHLENTQPVIDENPKLKNINGSKKRKEKKSKASTGRKSMDM